MKNKVLSVIILLLLVLLLISFQEEKGFSASELFFAKNRAAHPQSVKKPKYDYMSTFLSRNTKPLGLKEDLALKKFLKQPSIKWAIRAGERHILD